MVEVEQVIKIYRSHKDSFASNQEELEELNKKLNELDINCKVTAREDEDGETLIFEKTE